MTRFILVLVLFTFSVFSFSYGGVKDEAIPPTYYPNGFQPQMVESTNSQNTIKYDYKVNNTQMTDWIIVDSLANSLSYYNNSNYPVGVDKNTGDIYMVMRGSHEIGTQGFGEQTSKNNLFMRYSTDAGVTWSEKELVYSTNDGFGQGRYPSIFVKSDATSGNVSAYFNGPLVNEQAGEWYGYVFGLALFSEGGFIRAALPANDPFDFEGNTYAYGRYTFNSDEGIFEQFPTPSPVVGYGDGLSIFRGFTAVPVRRVPGELTDNSAIAIASSDELSQVSATIPPRLQSSNYEPNDSLQFRSSVVRDLRLDDAGNTYMYLFANFSGDNQDILEPAMTVSTDQGVTWGEYEKFPKSVIDDYVISNWGLTSEGWFFASSFTTDVLIKENGDYSYFITIVENTDETGDDFSQTTFELVELYKEAGEYGIRKIAELPPVRPFVSNGENFVISAMDYEVQAAKTQDENGYLVKWLIPQEIEINQAQGTYGYGYTDVFMSYRRNDMENWSTPSNLTEGDMFENKGTWIPNIIPNDYNDIMLLRTTTRGDRTQANQRLYIEDQYVETAKVMFEDLEVNSLNSEIPLENDIIASIYPNPAQDKINLSLNIKNTTNGSIRLYDIDGNLVKDFYNGNFITGNFEKSFSIEKISQGNYILKVTLDNVNVSQIIKIVR